MSCFGGRMSEYERISLDRFDGKNLQSTVYFLSHLHEDHTVGLAEQILLRRLRSNKDIFLYCSEVTEVLLRASQKYQHLGPYIKSIAINTPTTIPVPDPLFPEVEKVTVTLLPAFHCPGSVMCLIEGSEGIVLYTGDFRWEHFHIEQMHHLRSGESVKKIKSLYVDTTFCMPENLFIPSRQQCIDATYHLVKEWTAKSPQHVVYFNLRAQYGHEPLLNALAARLGVKVHVSKRKLEVFSKVVEFQGNFTDDGLKSQIHACRREDTVVVDDDIIPCRSSHDPDKVLVILPTTMYFMQYLHLTLDKIVKKVDNQFFRVCYSFHSSYTEVKDLLAYLLPERVYPNVKPPGDATLAFTQHRLNMMLKECKEKAETEVIDVEVKELGTLKTRQGRAAKRQRTKETVESDLYNSTSKQEAEPEQTIPTDSVSEADSLDFGTPTKAPRHVTPPKGGTSEGKGRGKGRGKSKVQESESQPVVGTRRSMRRSAAAADNENISEVTPKKQKTERSITPDLFLTPVKSERSDISEMHSSYAGSRRSDSELDLTLSSQKSSESFEDILHRQQETSSWSLGSFMAAVSSSSLEGDESGCVCVLDDIEQADEDLDCFVMHDAKTDTTIRQSGKQKSSAKKKGKGKQTVADEREAGQDESSILSSPTATKPGSELFETSTTDTPVSVDETDGEKNTETKDTKTSTGRGRPGRRGRGRGGRITRGVDKQAADNPEISKDVPVEKDVVESTVEHEGKDCKDFEEVKDSSSIRGRTRRTTKETVSKESETTDNEGTRRTTKGTVSKESETKDVEGTQRTTKETVINMSKESETKDNERARRTARGTVGKESETKDRERTRRTIKETVGKESETIQETVSKESEMKDSEGTRETPTETVTKENETTEEFVSKESKVKGDLDNVDAQIKTPKTRGRKKLTKKIENPSVEETEGVKDGRDSFESPGKTGDKEIISKSASTQEVKKKLKEAEKTVSNDEEVNIEKFGDNVALDKTTEKGDSKVTHLNSGRSRQTKSKPNETIVEIVIDDEAEETKLPEAVGQANNEVDEQLIETKETQKGRKKGRPRSASKKSINKQIIEIPSSTTTEKETKEAVTDNDTVDLTDEKDTDVELTCGVEITINQEPLTDKVSSKSSALKDKSDQDLNEFEPKEISKLQKTIALKGSGTEPLPGCSKAGDESNVKSGETIKRLRFSRSRSFDMLDELENNSEFGEKAISQVPGAPDPDVYKTKWAFCFKDSDKMQTESEKSYCKVENVDKSIASDHDVIEDYDQILCDSNEKDKNGTEEEMAAENDVVSLDLMSENEPVSKTTESNEKAFMSSSKSADEDMEVIDLTGDDISTSTGSSNKSIQVKKYANVSLEDKGGKKLMRISFSKEQSKCTGKDVNSEHEKNVPKKAESNKLEADTQKVGTDNKDDCSGEYHSTENQDKKETNDTKVKLDEEKIDQSNINEALDHKTSVEAEIISSGDTVMSDVISMKDATDELTVITLSGTSENMNRKKEETEGESPTVIESSPEWLSCKYASSPKMSPTSKKEEEVFMRKTLSEVRDVSTLGKEEQLGNDLVRNNETDISKDLLDESLEKDTPKSDNTLSLELLAGSDKDEKEDAQNDGVENEESTPELTSTDNKSSTDATEESGTVQFSEKELEEKQEVKRQAMGFVCETDSDSDSDDSSSPPTPSAKELYDEYIELTSGASDAEGTDNEETKDRVSAGDKDSSSNEWLRSRTSPSRTMSSSESSDDEVVRQSKNFKDTTKKVKNKTDGGERNIDNKDRSGKDSETTYMNDDMELDSDSESNRSKLDSESRLGQFKKVNVSMSKNIRKRRFEEWPAASTSSTSRKSAKGYSQRMQSVKVPSVSEFTEENPVQTSSKPRQNYQKGSGSGATDSKVHSQNIQSVYRSQRQSKPKRHEPQTPQSNPTRTSNMDSARNPPGGMGYHYPPPMFPNLSQPPPLPPPVYLQQPPPPMPYSNQTVGKSGFNNPQAHFSTPSVQAPIVPSVPPPSSTPQVQALTPKGVPSALTPTVQALTSQSFLPSSSMNMDLLKANIFQITGLTVNEAKPSQQTEAVTSTTQSEPSQSLPVPASVPDTNETENLASLVDKLHQVTTILETVSSAKESQKTVNRRDSYDEDTRRYRDRYRTDEVEEEVRRRYRDRYRENEFEEEVDQRYRDRYRMDEIEKRRYEGNRWEDDHWQKRHEERHVYERGQSHRYDPYHDDRRRHSDEMLPPPPHPDDPYYEEWWSRYGHRERRIPPPHQRDPHYEEWRRHYEDRLEMEDRWPPHPDDPDFIDWRRHRRDPDIDDWRRHPRDPYRHERFEHYERHDRFIDPHDRFLEHDHALQRPRSRPRDRPYDPLIHDRIDRSDHHHGLRARSSAAAFDDTPQHSQEPQETVPDQEKLSHLKNVFSTFGNKQKKTVKTVVLSRSRKVMSVTQTAVQQQQQQPRQHQLQQESMKKEDNTLPLYLTGLTSNKSKNSNPHRGSYIGQSALGQDKPEGNEPY